MRNAGRSCRGKDSNASFSEIIDPVRLNAPVRCEISSFLVVPALRNGSLSQAARTSIYPTEKDTVRSHLREAAQAPASATDRLPRMGINPKRASGETRTKIIILVGCLHFTDLFVQGRTPVGQTRYETLM